MLLLFHFCLLIIFIYSFFAYRKIRKVQIGVLPRVQAPSPGSNPGFVDVSLSPFFISKHLLLWLCVTVSYNFPVCSRPKTKHNMKNECRTMVKTGDKIYRIIQLRNVIMNFLRST